MGARYGVINDPNKPTELNALLTSLSAHGGSPAAAMRAMSPLPRHAEELLDNAIIRVGRDQLVIADAMIAAGMVKPLPEWLGVMLVTSNKINEVGHAQVSMVPHARGERQVADRTEYSVPIPMIWDDFSFDARELAAAERAGVGLDTDGAEQATRNVNELIEDMTINGRTEKYNGNAIYGLLTHPDVSTVPFVGGTAWDDTGKTGTQILQDLLNQLAEMDANNQRGPFRLFIPRLYGLALSKEYAAGYPKTILSRLLEVPEIAGITVAHKLPVNTTVLMSMRSTTADLIIGQTPTFYSWALPGVPGAPLWHRQFVVMAVTVPRIKSDYNNVSGIVIGATS